METLESRNTSIIWHSSSCPKPIAENAEFILQGNFETLLYIRFLNMKLLNVCVLRPTLGKLNDSCSCSKQASLYAACFTLLGVKFYVRSCDDMIADLYNVAVDVKLLTFAMKVGLARKFPSWNWSQSLGWHIISALQQMPVCWEIIWGNSISRRRRCLRDPHKELKSSKLECKLHDFCWLLQLTIYALNLIHKLWTQKRLIVSNVCTWLCSECDLTMSSSQLHNKGRILVAYMIVRQLKSIKINTKLSTQDDKIVAADSLDWCPFSDKRFTWSCSPTNNALGWI